MKRFLPGVIERALDESSDSAMWVCCFARASASRNARSCTAASCWRLYVSTCSTAISRERSWVSICSI